MLITDIILLVSLLIGINVLQLKFTNPGSDHFIHFAYINSIRHNKGRFITAVQSFLNEDDFPDPQLYHWILAKLPNHFLEKYFRYFGLVINLLSLLVFISFVTMLHPYLDLQESLEKNLWSVGVLFVLTPFEYFSWNAKNVGLSARGFGLLFGHCFVYALTLYLYSKSFIFLVVAFTAAYIILLSSQFAFQFVFFFSIICGLFFQEIWIIVLPLVASVTFLITFPKWSVIFFKRQWNYKRVYSSILSKRFGLKSRYSIWRDFIYDFWSGWTGKVIVQKIEYIYRNPIVEVLIGFPSLVIYFFLYLFLPFHLEEVRVSVILTLVLVSLSIFLLTSFRPTRFLGEPQRYVEFTFPLMVFLPLSINFEFSVVIISIYSILIILFETIAIRVISRKQGGGKTEHEKKMELLNRFVQVTNDQRNVRIASNKHDVLKYFAARDFRILNVNLTRETSGGLHFNEIFPESFGDFSHNALAKLIKIYSINWVILENSELMSSQFNEKFKVEFEKVESIHHYTIYKKC